VNQTYVPGAIDAGTEDGIDLIAILTVWGRNKAILLGVPILVGAVTLAATFLIKPVYTARTVFLPPQQQQSAAASAMASLGAITSLAGLGGSTKTPGDQYVALMQTANVEDRIVDRFKLMELYDVKYRFQARRQLRTNAKILLGKKDGLITVEVDSTDPRLAADIANQYVAELRRLTSDLALTEAQQRRSFFEAELSKTKDKLAAAQESLQASGFTAGALRAEPKAAAEGYARVKAELTAAEIRLQALRQTLTDASAEVQKQSSVVASLTAEVHRLESQAAPASDTGYLGKYREYKYQEALFEIYAKQFELARLDESRDGGAMQIVDVATVPEYKSKPGRLTWGMVAGFLTFALLAIFLPLRASWRSALEEPSSALRLRALSDAWSGRSV
jgi:uncharacterized protein involved in exopolysaccharide biosynthesis